MAKSEEGPFLPNANSETRWKQKPTLIAVPKKGGNPWGKNPNNRNRPSDPEAGPSNSISTRASRNLHSEELGPPQKRRKLEGSSGHGGKITNKYLKSRPPLAPEENYIIDVDGDSDEGGPYEPKSNSMRRSSPDELNLASQPSSTSKYSFSRPTPRRQGRHSVQDLAQDGPDTVWANDHYTKDESDPIEDTSDPPFEFPRKGNVKEKVKIYDPNTPSPKIDLTKVQKPQSKAKGMKTKLAISHLMPTPSVSKANGEQSNHLSATSTRADNGPEPLPVESLFLDNDYYPQAKGQKLELFWTTDCDVVIKANESKVYSFRLTPDFCRSSTTSDPPTIVLQVRPFTGHELVTIKFNTDHPDWRSRLKKQYEKFRKIASRSVQMPTTKDGERLLQAAALQAATPQATILPENDTDTLHKSTDVDRRMEDLARIQQGRKPPSLGPGTRKRKASSVIQSTPPPRVPPGSSSAVDDSVENASESRHSNPTEVPPSGLRRSARNAPPEKGRAADPDELILVYPPGPGAVNITRGDLDRLQPYEFLNDTLIEFGLKLWLKDLANTNPTLASQIHIFNSFFYKKLNGAKDVNQAFESVRKWTSKFDIFAKKYIIVPINEHLHWYLAIICEPEHILSRKKAMTPVVRKQTRSSAQAVIPAPVETPPDADDQDDQIVTSSEAEVERSLNDNFRSSCIIEPNDADSCLPVDIVEGNGAGSPAALSYVTDEDDGTSGPTTVRTLSRPSSDLREASPASSSIYMAVDSKEDPDVPLNYVPVGASNPRPPASKNAKGKGKANPEPEVQMLEDDVEKASSTQSQQQTFIFVMDSLGTRHPQAVKKLSKYLVLEAKDKKGIEDAGEAEGRFASVPVQPNFCDCGVYLLHFAQTFMSNPAYYTTSILTQPKHISNPDRQKLWKDYKVAQMREDLIRNIKLLSKSWQKERTKEEIPSSDGEVEIVEKKSVKKPVKSQARRIRG